MNSEVLSRQAKLPASKAEPSSLHPGAVHDPASAKGAGQRPPHGCFWTLLRRRHGPDSTSSDSSNCHQLYLQPPVAPAPSPRTLGHGRLRLTPGSSVSASSSPRAVSTSTSLRLGLLQPQSHLGPISASASLRLGLLQPRSHLGPISASASLRLGLLRPWSRLGPISASDLKAVSAPPRPFPAFQPPAPSSHSNSRLPTTVVLDPTESLDNSVPSPSPDFQQLPDPVSTVQHRPRSLPRRIRPLPRRPLPHRPPLHRPTQSQHHYQAGRDGLL